jgi:hypothetical protein
LVTSPTICEAGIKVEEEADKENQTSTHLFSLGFHTAYLSNSGFPKIKEGQTKKQLLAGSF